MRCIYVDFFLPRWPVTIFSDIRNKKISSSDQSILALGDVSNTSSTSSVKIITSPKCKIISVIDVSSSDGSSNYGSSLSISTLTISTKVRMPPSSMKGKRESNENASNMSDLGTSSEEEEAPVAAAAAVIMSTVKQEPGTRNQARPWHTSLRLLSRRLVSFIRQHWRLWRLSWTPRTSRCFRWLNDHMNVI